METLCDLPFVRLSADKTGTLADGNGLALPSGITDLVVLSHGWKNSEHDALTLYKTLLDNVRRAAGPAFDADERHWAVAGVFWPAFRFQPDLSLLPEDGSAALADGVRGAAQAVRDLDMPLKTLSSYAAEVGMFLGKDGALFAKEALNGSAGGPLARGFVDRLRHSLTRDAGLEADHHVLWTEPGGELVHRLAMGGSGATLRFEEAKSDPGKGCASGFREIVQHVRQWRAGNRAAIATILNQATYFEMKARAATVGAALAPIVEQAAPVPLRVHLIGHSFGARLVSALTEKLTSVSPASLTLLQGAFSHNGFGSEKVRRTGGAERDGAFRRIIKDKRVSGPFVITHTRRDTAVGFFYPLASTLSREVAAGFHEVARTLIGGADDRHGGLGANGALSLPPGESEDHVAVLRGGRVHLKPRVGPDAMTLPAFAAGRVHNVLSDAIISEHNDVGNPEVAQLVWAAIR